MGAGSFGTAIAWMLRESGINVRMWAFKEEEARAINETHHNAVLLPECDLTGVYATHQVADAVSGADGVIVVTPSFGVRGVLQQMAGCVADDTPVLLLSKGLDPESGETFVKVACNILGGEVTFEKGIPFMAAGSGCFDALRAALQAAYHQA